MKKHYFKTVGILLLSLFSAVKSFAQAPANDDCTGAIQITQASSSAQCTGTLVNTVGATTATYTSNCWATSYDDDVWYQFTATSAQVYIKVTNISVAGEFIGWSLFEASCAGTEVSCSGNADGDSVYVSGLTAGTVYFLSGFYQGTTATGTFNLCIFDAPAPPANDNCAGAINIPVANTEALCSGTTVNTSLATTATYTSNCWSSSYDDDVWYSFMGTSDTMIIKTSNLSAVAGAPGFSVFSGDCTTPVEVFCGGNGTGYDTLTGMVAGQTYLLSTFYQGTTDRGTFDLCIFSQFPVGIKENVIENSLNVFPNPANDKLTVKFNTSKVNNLSVKISDVEGKVVYSRNESNFSGNFNENINVSNFGKGVYMIQIISDNSITTEKVVIQ